MENASKALIIAGAVLISILLIGASMLIYNSATGSFDTAQSTMSEMEIQSFNSQFTLYEGNKKPGMQVLQLLDKIASSNSLTHNLVAVKLSARDFVMDSCKYAIFDDKTNELIKCHSNTIVSLDEMIAYVNKYRDNNYNVTFYYCNKKTESSGNNKPLNPVAGRIILIHIYKN